jgi:integrase
MRPYKSFPGMSDEDAARAAEEWFRGWLESKNQPTVCEALSDYVGSLQTLGASANTVRTYGGFVRRYLMDLADMRVSQVTTKDIDANLQRLLRDGHDNGGALSATSVQVYKAFLQGAWRTFVKQGTAETNVARDTMRIHATRYEAKALDETDVQKLTKAVKHDLMADATPDDKKGIAIRNGAMAVFLALLTGARVGEVAALRRRDVSIAARRMTICGNVVDVRGEAVRQNKTKGKKTRTLTIDQGLADALREHQRWQDTYLLNTGRDTPICTTDGNHMKTGDLSRTFTRYRNELGLDHALTFHSLRHTHATFLLQPGTNPRVVQERLGHANVTTTLAIYSHVLPANDARAADAFAEMINM